MTKEKQTANAARWVVGILAALMFGAFLGSPVPEIWAGQISKTMSAVSVQMAETEKLHSGAAAGNAVIKTAAEVKTAAEENNEVEVVVSDTPAEEQPDYICLNANRGGAADRKEKDVLIRLINAEAYGLSYKAKVAVGQVVMNRWTGPYYGDDLLAIMTAPYQFTPIYDGSAYEKEIEPDSIKAANAVLSGAGVMELTGDTYYFVDPDFTEDKTIEQEMTFVCEIEGIHFFKPPTK
jgi:spore germination cell wall hydrolase CwlJ-like protein